MAGFYHRLTLNITAVIFINSLKFLYFLPIILLRKEVCLMNINMNIGMRNNTINLNGIKNQNLNQNQSVIQKNDALLRRDTVSISPLGKSKSIIQSLMNQKQKITESKNELISRNLEKGGDMADIKSQLKSFEEQLESIDEQIAQTMAEQMKQQEQEQNKVETKKPKTEEEAQTQRFNSLINLSSSLDKAQVISSVKTKSDGEARVLESEIKIDEGRGGASKMKKERLADLQKQSTTLATQIADSLNEVNEQIKDTNNTDIVEQGDSAKNRADSTTSARDSAVNSSDHNTPDKAVKYADDKE